MKKILLFTALCLFLVACGQRRQLKAMPEEDDSTTIELSKLAPPINKPVKDNVNNYSNKLDVTKSAWEYYSKTDEMYNTTTYYADLVSDNIVHFDFPYEGGSKLLIEIRHRKRDGNRVLLQISSGHFDCNEYQGTNYVLVKFDKSKPIRYTCTGTKDGASDVMFISRCSDFIKKARNAKSILLEANFFRHGPEQFYFNSDVPLEWKH